MPGFQSFQARKARVIETLGKLEEISFAGSLEQEEVISQKLSKLVKHAVTNTWWQSRLNRFRYGEDSVREFLNSVAILTRSELQRNWDQMQVPIAGASEEQFVVASTSGSTGKPVKVRKYIPIFARNNMAAQLLTFQWHQINVSKPMTILRWNGNPSYQKNAGQPYIYLGKTGSKRSIKLSATTFREVIEVIERDKTSIIFANPTAISALLRDGELRNYSFPHIDFFLSFAERLDSDLRNLVKIQSNAKIIDRYTAEEVGVIALQCPYQEHLHSISTHNYLEIVDEQGNPCEVGKPGRVLVTALHSYGMPLIRYELGDLASFGEPCPSGITLPVIKPEIVRVKDRLIDDRGQLFTPSAAGAKSLKQSRIRDFQVLLFDNAIAVLYEAATPLNYEEIGAVTKDLQSRFRTQLPVNCIFQESLAWAGYWKRKDFVRVAEPYDGDSQISSFKRFLGI